MKKNNITTTITSCCNFDFERVYIIGKDCEKGELYTFRDTVRTNYCDKYRIGDYIQLIRK